MSEPKKKGLQKPTKGQAAVGLGAGILTIVLSLAVVIPRFGVVGMVLAMAAVAVTAVSVHFLVSATLLTGQTEEELPPAAEPPEARLKTLQSLYESKLITHSEYEEKRKEILKEL